MPAFAQLLDGNYNPIKQIVGTPVTASATATATNQCQASLPADTTGKTTYITGFTCLSGFATTSVTTLVVTVAGTTGGTMSFQFTEPLAAANFGGELVVSFSAPIPASAANTAITVTIPANANSGASSISVYGFQL